MSGAIQHIVGAKAAKRILAINTDRDAPIMAVANYAVIGDLHQVVPAITAEIRRVTGG
jgi:electron transfer flavoprotein alpha subunit